MRRVAALLAACAAVTACGGSPARPSETSGPLPPCGPAPSPRPSVTTTIPCPTPAEFDELQRNHPVVHLTDPSAGTLRCRADQGSVDLTPDQAHMYLSLLFLRRLTFDRPLPWTSVSVWDWLRSLQLRTVVDVGTRNAYYSGGTIHVFLHPPYTPPPWPLTVDRSEFEGLVHEARHADGGGHTCNGGKSDRKASDLGAFGTQYYLLKWIADDSHEPADVRAYASYRAWQLRQSAAFCEECTTSGADQAALSLSVEPNPIVAIPVGDTDNWGCVFTLTITETAGVNVVVESIEWDVIDGGGRSLSRMAKQTTMSQTVRAWNTVSFHYNSAFPFVFTPATTTTHEATLTIAVHATDERGNTLTASVSAAVR